MGAAFLCEAHRSSSRSDASLNGDRLGQSLEMPEARRGRFRYLEHTPADHDVPPILKPLSYSNVMYSGLADESTEVFMGEESES